MLGTPSCCVFVEPCRINFSKVVLLGSSISTDPNIQSVFYDHAIGKSHPCFLSLRVCTEESGSHALSIDVQNYCAVRHSRLSVRDVEREASPAAVLAIPYCAYSDRW